MKSETQHQTEVGSQDLAAERCARRSSMKDKNSRGVKAWARGYFCAVAKLLEMECAEGVSSPTCEALFMAGGDPWLADKDDIETFRRHGFVVPTPPRATKIDFRKVAELWQRKKTIPEIAAALRIKVHTAGARVRRARQLLGVASVPRRETGAVLGMNRRASSLDEIHAIGDVVQVAVAEIRSRQSLHQAARTRGWKIKVRILPTQQWEVSAVEAVSPLAVTRRKTSLAATTTSSLRATPSDPTH